MNTTSLIHRFCLNLLYVPLLNTVSVFQLISFIIVICYAASTYGGYSAVAICEMVFAIVFFGIFMMQMDKQFLVVNWVWSVSTHTCINAHIHI